MPNFYVNRNKDNKGHNEVHETAANCGHHADHANRVSLGTHATCKGAVQDARRRGYNSNGCYYCANDCHTG